MNWRSFRTILYNYLKGAAVKAALLKFLGSAVAGGWKAWVIKFLVKEAMEEVIIPLLNYMQREALFGYDIINGKLKVKRIDKAKEEGDEETYWDTIGSI